MSQRKTTYPRLSFLSDFGAICDIRNRKAVGPRISKNHTGWLTSHHHHLHAGRELLFLRNIELLFPFGFLIFARNRENLTWNALAQGKHPAVFLMANYSSRLDCTFQASFT